MKYLTRRTKKSDSQECVVFVIRRELSDLRILCVSNLPQPPLSQEGAFMFPLDKGDTARPRGFAQHLACHSETNEVKSKNPLASRFLDSSLSLRMKNNLKREEKFLS